MVPIVFVVGLGYVGSWKCRDPGPIFMGLSNKGNL